MRAYVRICARTCARACVYACCFAIACIYTREGVSWLINESNEKYNAWRDLHVGRRVSRCRRNPKHINDYGTNVGDRVDRHLSFHEQPFFEKLGSIWGTASTVMSFAIQEPPFMYCSEKE